MRSLSRGLLLLAALSVAARSQGIVRVEVRAASDSSPLAGSLVRSGGTTVRTDEAGRASVQRSDGALIASRIGFLPDSAMVTAGTSDTAIVILLRPSIEIPGMLISATRSQRRVEDDPLRVEVLAREEIEEKLRMTPGDISMMLNESSGLRVQTTSPSLGGANVRVQGMRGRYTQILADGLPIFGAQTGSLGLLQIPPMDLGGVEIVKGVASALYGGSAIGGVVNLLSRRPEEEPVSELLVNQTFNGGTDLVGFGARSLGAVGMSLLAGGHRQRGVDVDDDAWIDVPAYERLVLRPRLFWSTPRGHDAMLTAGATIEDRDGGTMDGGLAPNGQPYPERLRTRRFDAGGTATLAFSPATISIRASASAQDHRHVFGSRREDDRHITWFSEASASRMTSRAGLWVLGASLQQERYANDDVAGFDYVFTTPGVFAQNTLDIGSRVSATASARLDHHGEYGTQFAPRLSTLLRLFEGWSLRLSTGSGYFAPTPFTEETEVTGLSPVTVPARLRAERAWSSSVDLGGHTGPVEVGASLFASRVAGPAGVVETGPGSLALVNFDLPSRTHGAELFARWMPEPFHFTASYTYVRATEFDPSTGERDESPLTPRHQAGIVGAWESEESGRAGVEVYYTGRQRLRDNPYRTEAPAGVHIGLLLERRIGPVRAFINAENLLDHRQTRHDRLVLPARGAGGRWTTDAWAPLDGRVANIGLRFGVQ